MLLLRYHRRPPAPPLCLPPHHFPLRSSQLFNAYDSRVDSRLCSSIGTSVSGLSSSSTPLAPLFLPSESSLSPHPCCCSLFSPQLPFAQLSSIKSLHPSIPRLNNDQSNRAIKTMKQTRMRTTMTQPYNPLHNPRVSGYCRPSPPPSSSSPLNCSAFSR